MHGQDQTSLLFSPALPLCCPQERRRTGGRALFPPLKNQLAPSAPLHNGAGPSCARGASPCGPSSHHRAVHRHIAARRCIITSRGIVTSQRVVTSPCSASSHCGASVHRASHQGHLHHKAKRRGSRGLNLGLKQYRSCVLQFPKLKKSSFLTFSLGGKRASHAAAQLEGKSAAALCRRHRPRSEGETSANSHK